MVTKEEVIQILKEYVDPELMIDVWTLGLIYEITISSENAVRILITFTSPLCPYGPAMLRDLTDLIKAKGAKEVEMEVTFEPPWKPSDEVREMLGV